MRGGKPEGKMPGPLFPRLHVNDTDKGGPKPPPRNKMALYEQLSIPSQRLTDAPAAAAAMLPLPPVFGGTLANTDSSTQGGGLEKPRFPAFQTSSASYHSNLRQGSFSSDGVLNESNGSSVRILMPTTHAGELNDDDDTHLKWPSQLKNSVEYKARSIFNPAVNSGANNTQSCSLRLQSALVKKPETSTSADYDSDGKLKALNEAGQDNSKNVTPVVTARDNILPVISLKPIIGEKHPERSSQLPASSNSQQKGCEVLCQETPLAYSHTDPLNSVQNEHRHEDESESTPVPANVMNRKEDPSSNVISPDDVVEMIGHKQFWKVRRAIINQQRVFSMQVFELHRIVKVQRIITGSRHLLMEESLFLREAIPKPSSLKEPTPNLVPDNSPLLAKLNDIAPKIKDQPRTLLNDDFTAGIPKIGHKFGKLPMWGLPPSVGNQWLVPVMSPSEGLIYKPYTEPPCPPPGGYLPTFYGACGPGPNLPVAPSIGPTYFPPYLPGSNIEHISAKVDSKDKDREMCSIYQSSCIVASERNVEKLETKGIFPRKKIQEDALPLFPTVPTGYGAVQPVTSTHNNEQKTQVIKVIPHNPKLASESAARIIQLIQEERKHLCN